MRYVQRAAVCFCILMTALLTVLAIPGMAEEIYVPTEPFTWDYLATIGGCAVVVLIVVQLTKNLLDKLVKIPTAIYAYILAVIVMNILWWTGTQFLELNNNHNITETARPFHQQVMQHK